jgi:hypothetical protein
VLGLSQLVYPLQQDLAMARKWFAPTDQVFAAKFVERFKQFRIG